MNATIHVAAAGTNNWVAVAQCDEQRAMREADRIRKESNLTLDVEVRGDDGAFYTLHTSAATR